MRWGTCSSGTRLGTSGVGSMWGHPCAINHYVVIRQGTQGDRMAHGQGGWSESLWGQHLSKGGYAESEPIDEHGFAQAGVLMTSGCLDGCLVGSRAAAAGLAAGPTASRGPVLLPSTLALLPWWPC